MANCLLRVPALRSCNCNFLDVEVNFTGKTDNGPLDKDMTAVLLSCTMTTPVTISTTPPSSAGNVKLIAIRFPRHKFGTTDVILLNCRTHTYCAPHEPL